MTYVTSLGTYLPPWGTAQSRAAGIDEDVITLAVEAGRAAMAAGTPVERVVLVTTDIPQLEGGLSAVLLAGLDLDSDIEVTVRLGGAAAVLDAVLSARARTLIIGTDLNPAGAAAALTETSGVLMRPVSRVARSLPVRVHDSRGVVYDYGDPRLLRERGVLASLSTAGVTPRLVAGVDPKLAKAVSSSEIPALPTTGASASLFALCWMIERQATGPLIGFEQATLTGATVETGTATVYRVEPEARTLPTTKISPGNEIPISLAAYDRAFDAKLRFRASRRPDTGALDFPPRTHVCDDGTVLPGDDLVALPRTATVYTGVTIRVPVPGLAAPYSLVIVELDEVGVRALVKVTGAEPGEVSIGDRGKLVLRRVAVRSGVSDYGYAFAPEPRNEQEQAA